MSALVTEQKVSSVSTVSEDGPKGGGDLSVASLSSLEEMEGLRPDWNSLLAKNPKLTIFSSPEWLISWWRAYGNGKDLRLLTFRDHQGALIGLIALYLKKARFGILPSLRELRLVGDGTQDSDNLDFVVLPGREKDVAYSLFRHLATNRDWDVCQLNCLASDSPTSDSFLRKASDDGWKVETSTLPWSAVELPDTWEAYLKNLSAKERGKVGNRLRRLQARHSTKFYKCCNPEELNGCIESLFRLHQKRWESRGEPGSFASPERCKFYFDMAQQFLSRGWLELWLFELDGVAVAAQFGFRHGQTVYSLQEGFDPDYSSDSVGYVLRSYVLREFIESGARRYEFLAGENESKLRWGGTTGTYLNIHVARHWTRGSLYMTSSNAKKATKFWLRRILPPSFVEFLRSSRRKFVSP